MTNAERTESLLRNLPVERRHLRVVEDDDFEARMAALADYGIQGEARMRALADYGVQGGVAGDADQGQVLDHDIEDDEPEGHADKISFWKEVAMWTESGAQYERAQAALLALGVVDQSPDAQAVADSTAASVARGERRAHEPTPLAAAQAAARDAFAAHLVSPFAQTVPMEVLARDPRSGLTAWLPAKTLTRSEAVTVAEKLTGQINLHESLAPTKMVRVKKITQRDPQENISEVFEYDIEVPVGADGAPVLPSSPPLPTT